MNFERKPRPWRLFWSSLSIIAILIVTGPYSSASLTAQDSKAPNRGRAQKSEGRKSIIRQSSPATCGTAALATLLTFYFNDPVTEEEMVELTRTRNKPKSSLRVLRDACRDRGYEADGFPMQLPQLLEEIETNGAPVLVFFKEPTDHFVLVLGRVGDSVLVSDPSRGVGLIHQTDFLRRWNKVGLVVKSSRPTNRDLLERQKHSAETRMQTLRRANSLMSKIRL